MISSDVVLYDFTLCYLPQFAHLRMEVHGGCLSEPLANEFAFSSMVRDMFARCYDVNNKLKKNELYLGVSSLYLRIDGTLLCPYPSGLSK